VIGLDLVCVTIREGCAFSHGKENCRRFDWTERRICSKKKSNQFHATWLIQ